MKLKINYTVMGNQGEMEMLWLLCHYEILEYYMLNDIGLL